MALNVGQMVSELRRMTVMELRRKCVEVFGEQTRSYHKDFLVRRIAWRMQANAEGGLPERARQRALEIANDADLRTRAPGPAMPPTPAKFAAVRGKGMTKVVEVPADSRLPMPGALLGRSRGWTAARTPFLKVECDSGADQLFERRFLNRVILVDVDGPSCDLSSATGQLRLLPYIPDRSKQQGRRFPAASIEQAFLIRRARVSACLAETIQ